MENSNCPTQNSEREIKNQIRLWANEHRITHASLNQLLTTLRFAGFTFLPKDSRTLLGTPVTVPIKILTKGTIWYNGIEKCSRNEFSGIQKNMSITLDFNFDGAPVGDSSTKEFWPILSSVRGKHHSK